MIYQLINYWFMKWRMSAVLRGQYLRDLRIPEYQPLLLRNEGIVSATHRDTNWRSFMFIQIQKKQHV